MSLTSRLRLRAAAAVYGVSQREYQRQRAAKIVPGLRELESYGVFEPGTLAELGLEPIPTAGRARARAPRDLAGQNARANARARALGYTSKDDQYARRRRGNPTAADLQPDRGGATWARLTRGRIFVRVNMRDDVKRDAGEQRIDAITPTLPPDTMVTITVRLSTGDWLTITPTGGIAATELEQRGLTYTVAWLMAGWNAGTSSGGTGAGKNRKTPDLPAGAPGGDGEPDYSLFESVELAQVTFSTGADAAAAA